MKMVNFISYPQSINQSDGKAAGTGWGENEDLDQGGGTGTRRWRMDSRNMKETG